MVSVTRKLYIINAKQPFNWGCVVVLFTFIREDEITPFITTEENVVISYSYRMYAIKLVSTLLKDICKIFRWLWLVITLFFSGQMTNGPPSNKTIIQLLVKYFTVCENYTSCVHTGRWWLPGSSQVWHVTQPGSPTHKTDRPPMTASEVTPGR